MVHSDLALIARVALGFVLSFVVGFEREIRGAPAGDRTFALVGTGAAAITAVTLKLSPQAVAGVITGVGFIGAGLVLRSREGMLVGITSAAAVFAVTAIGVVAGANHPLLALFLTAVVLGDLELRHLPVLRIFDGRRWVNRFTDDSAPPLPMRRRNPPPPAS